MCVESAVSLSHGLNVERFNVDGGHDDFGCVADMQGEAADSDGVGERGACQRDVDASIEFGPVGAIHFSPATATIVTDPQIGLVHVTEQQELTHLPTGGKPHDVLHVVALHDARRSPCFVVPTEREVFLARTGVAVRVCVSVCGGFCRVPRGPAGAVSIGREGAVRSGMITHPCSLAAPKHYRAWPWSRV